MQPISRRKYLFPELALFAAAMFFSLIGIANTQYWGGDFSQYLAQARSIVEGNINEWFACNSFIIDHSASGLGAHAYPWLTSVLIAPIYAIWGINYIPYQVFMSVCFAVAVIALYCLLIKRNVNHHMALFVCGAVIFNINFLILTKKVVSDIPCLMFTVLTWFMLDRYINTRNISNALLVGTFAFAAVFARTMALALLVSLGVVDIGYLIKSVNRKTMTVRSLFITGIPYLTFLILYIVLSFTLPKGGSTYLDYFSFDVKHILSNIAYYCIEFFSLFSQEVQSFQWLPGAQIILATIAVLLIPCFVVFLQGMIRQMKKSDHLPFYLMIMLMMLCAYNYREGRRFIISLFPVVLLFCWYGIAGAEEQIGESGSGTEETENRSRLSRSLLLKLCSVAFASVMIFSMMIGIANIASGNTGSEKAEKAANSENAVAAYTYISDHLSRQNVVLFFKPRVLYLYTGVFAYTNKMDLPDTVRGADYILNYSGDSRFDEFIHNHTDSLTQVFSNEQFTLYKIDK